ncbi:hypothetical protein BDV93DRAFT_570615 [Ceratobasidium sp. AG-I]|nr:hypothetical protein BDV93DRAFT_570615 [Ceratobasidium sp. AG-I]
MTPRYTRSSTNSLAPPRLQPQDLSAVLSSEPESGSSDNEPWGAPNVGQSEPAALDSSAHVPIRVPTQPTMNPGVFTDENLQVLNLELLVDHGVWYCRICRQNPTDLSRVIGMGTSHVSSHMENYHALSLKEPGVKSALASLDDYEAWDGQGPAPAPKSMVAPFPFLETKTIRSGTGGVIPEACPFCTGPSPFIWITGTTRWKHLGTHGATFANAPKGRQFDQVQSFTNYDKHNRYFPVNSALSTLHTQLDGYDRLVDDALVEYIDKACLSRIEPILPMGPSLGMEGENPFLNAQGWPQHFAGEDSADLAGLVAFPAKKDPWVSIYLASLQLLQDYQKTISTTNQKVRKQWVDAGNGPDNAFITQFNKLQTLTATRSYARHFSRLILLILRVKQKSKSKQPKGYMPFLTPDQAAHAEQLLKLLRSKSNTKQLKQCIHKLAVACFAPVDINLTAQSQYHDITHVFIALSAVKAAGSYYSPAELVRSTTALQYSMRAVLLQESTSQATGEFGGDITSCFKHYRNYLLDNDEITPFSTLRTLRRLLLDTVASTAGMGNLHWAGNNRSHCSYKGYSFQVSKVQLLAQTAVDRSEELLNNKVLRGLSLEDIDYQEPDYLALRDQKDEYANHYSVWNDHTNVSLHTSRDKLLVALTRHPSVKDEFCHGALPNKTIDWRNNNRMKWLRDVGEFVESLAISAHIHGGQARRATELCSVRVRNIEGRVRDVFLHGEDLLFITGYSKTAATTLRDRMDVHVLPPRLTRLFFILETLVRPLAVLWTKELIDPISSTSTATQVDSAHGVSRSQLATQDHINEAGSPEDDEAQGSGIRDDDEETQSSNGMDLDDIELPQPNTEAVQDISALDSDAETDDSPEYDDDKHDTALGNPQAILPSRIQAIYAFASLGFCLRPSRFSQLFAKITKEILGVELGVQGWRHVSIAIQRDLLGLVDDTGSRSVDTVFDAQAAHSSKVSKTYYAVDSGDRALVGAGSIEKYVRASQLWQDWLNGIPAPSSVNEVAKLTKEIHTLQSEMSGVKSELELVNARLGKVLHLLEKF